MSLGVKIALGALLTCVAISLIIAIPLQTAGYNNHATKNEALVATECTVVEQQISPATCYRSCNCYTTCMPYCTTNTINMHTTTNCNNRCTQHCQSCPYTCYTAAWLVRYSPIDHLGQPITMVQMDGNSSSVLVPTEFSARLNTPVMSYDSTGLAQGALNARPIGSKFVCYYDSTNLGDVRLDKYDLTGFYASYVTFYVLAGISALFSFGLVIYILISRQ